MSSNTAEATQIWELSPQSKQSPGSTHLIARDPAPRADVCPSVPSCPLSPACLCLRLELLHQFTRTAEHPRAKTQVTKHLAACARHLPTVPEACLHDFPVSSRLGPSLTDGGGSSPLGTAFLTKSLSRLSGTSKVWGRQEAACTTPPQKNRIFG